MAHVALVNYGSGNYSSVAIALTRLGIPFGEARTPGDLEAATHIILPGVGAFGAAMRRLDEQGLSNAIREHARDKSKPFLGICVGMQVLADVGREHGEHPGLGLIPGSVEKIDTSASDLPLPHIGWNELEGPCDDPLLAGLGTPPTFYFVHSFAFRAADPAHVAAHCDYGTPVTAVVRSGAIWGVQFHPEKSQQDGLGLLANFMRQGDGNA